jgi:NitT/TauT family transport system ATP-binding protein
VQISRVQGQQPEVRPAEGNNDAAGYGTESREPPNSLSISDVSFSYSTGAVALSHVSLEVHQGEFVSIVGPSGCGKSTLLLLVAGLKEPSTGIIGVDGRRVTAVPEDVGFVFQKDLLLPWKTVLQNVTLPLRLRKRSSKDQRDMAMRMLGMMGLEHLTDRYPHQLSGGQRKRVAIAASLVYQPKVLLMDEPFSALDVQTRIRLESDILALWERLGHQTVLFVTHDLEEAITLSDRVVVMTAGPGRVLREYDVPLPRPRDLVKTKFTEQFTEMSALIWDDLKVEVERAAEQSR